MAPLSPLKLVGQTASAGGVRCLLKTTASGRLRANTRQKETAMDLGTGVALLGSAKVLEKLLGPTADYIGMGAKDCVQRRRENVNRIFEKATRKLGPKIESSGTVPPRVIEGVVNGGSFCDDELGAEYFGGVLASSRSDSPRDDRGAVLNALITRLSSYQLRTHYILYTTVRKLFTGSGLTLTLKDRPKLQTFVPYSVYAQAMQFSGSEGDQPVGMLEHVFFGLSRESLIESFMYGQAEDLKERYPGATDEGILYTPTVLGAELFLWAHGHSSASAIDLLDPGNAFSIDVSVVIQNGPCATRPLPNQPGVEPDGPSASGLTPRR